MKTSHPLLAAALLAFASLAWAAADTETGPVFSQMKAVSAAWESGDQAALESLLAKDFVHIDGRGAVQTRSEFIENSRQRLGRASEFVELQLKSYGEVSIVTGEKRFADASGPRRPMRFTQVWVKDAGAWQLSSFQVTVVVNPQPASLAR